MTAREPWFKHKFQAQLLARNSCVICGGKKDDTPHLGRPKPWKRMMASVVKRPSWRIYE
jgi:hypothetical protein